MPCPGRLLSTQELAVLRAAAMVYVGGQQPSERVLTVQGLLDQSGVGASAFSGSGLATGSGGRPSAAVGAGAGSPVGGGGGASGTAPAAGEGRGPSDGPAPQSDLSLASVPCLGPIATLSDTKQSVVLHLTDDASIQGWASHFSPRKYDVKAGEFFTGHGFLCMCVCERERAERLCVGRKRCMGRQWDAVEVLFGWMWCSWVVRVKGGGGRLSERE